jgi:hypothetical protein
MGKQDEQLSQPTVSSSNMVKFQIEENWGDGCKAFIYFNADKNAPIEKLKEIAENEAKKDWRKISQLPKILGLHTPFRPTILVSEYANGKRVKGGISFKTKWR